jgi:hypothetical protein
MIQRGIKPHARLSSARYSSMHLLLPCFFWGWLGAGLLSTNADETAPGSKDLDYNKHIRPILKTRCFECHDEARAKASLRLDSTQGLKWGGDSGEPLIQSGKPQDSLLVRRIVHEDPEERMPPEGEPVSARELELIIKWIRQGAVLPSEKPESNAFYETDHWSFQPIRRPEIPLNTSGLQGNPVDAFIRQKLLENNIPSSEQAGPSILLRRLALLTKGLPPTPAELEAFENDKRPDAWKRRVDEALASPMYGERWARHWLDVVRYADSNGFETNRERKSAWLYRDYVIQAFNTDLPYDQFIREQLAGDFFGQEAATGFLVAGPYDIVKSPDMLLTLTQRQNELDDMINTTGTAFLGLTLGCARCHNHKFDPIHQKEYYALQAVFAGVHHGERALRKDLPQKQREIIQRLRLQLTDHEREIEGWKEQAKAKNVYTKGKQRPSVNALLNEEYFQPVETKSIRFNILASSSAEPCIDELEVFDTNNLNVALTKLGSRPSASGTLQGYPIHKLKHLNDGLHGNTKSWISDSVGKGWVQIDLPEPSRIHKIIWSRDRLGLFADRIPTRYFIEIRTAAGEWKRIADSADRKPFNEKPDELAFMDLLETAEKKKVEALLQNTAALKSQLKKASRTEMVWAGQFKQPEVIHRLYRGDPMLKREVAPPGTLQVIQPVDMAPDEPEQQRRLKLARWIASPENPLTARVVVNRIWHYLFGRGIVETPSDFGNNGLAPSHPELLDYLADELIQSRWSIKHVQRLILNSNTFCQSSQPGEVGMRVDAEGRFLWRFTPRRLAAEPIRDSILFTSGALDTRMGGAGFYLLDVQVENVMHYFPKETFGPAEFRRMVYQTRIRQEQDAIFGAFDCPDGNQVIPNRSRSNTPIQALNLFNSRFVLQQSGILAQRLQNQFSDRIESQITQAFLSLHAKHPDPFEMQASKTLIDRHGLKSLCRALYNSNRFLFIF